MPGVTNEHFRQEWQFYNRTYIAQVISVNERDGTMSVAVLDGLGTKKENLEIPWLGFSLQGTKDTAGIIQNAFKSSWIRYMPQPYDLVYIAFGPHNEARVVGNAMQVGRYKALKKDMELNPSKYPSGELIDLKPGEFDMRSSGGAYIYGSKDGTLLLSAGPASQLRLSKARSEMKFETGMFEAAGSETFLRLGDIKRTLLPTDFAESKVGSLTDLVTLALDPVKAVFATELAPLVALDGAEKEYWLHLENTPTVPGTPATLLVDDQLGAVRGSDGTPVFSTVAPIPLTTPLRSRRKIYASGSTTLAPVEAFTSEVDALGNANVEFGDTATAVDISSSLGALTASFLTAELTGTATVDLTSEGVATVDAPVVKLGANATHPVLQGDTLATLLTTLATACATANTALAANLALSSPVQAAQYTAMATAYTAFASTVATALSTKVVTE